jgi:DNA-directed RNA polymerase subunit M/transcription elongation factor TFIIS
MEKGFDIICRNCGNKDNIRLLPYKGEYESTVTIVCEKCDNTFTEYCH